MRKVRRIATLITVLLSCLTIFTSAQSKERIMQAAESDAKVIYNGKEADIGLKPVLIEGSNYLAIRAVSSLFEKSIYWNQNENKIVISDKTDPMAESLASEIALKDGKIKELEAKVKKLENDEVSEKKLSIRELQDKVNNEHDQYESVNYNVILSGNEDEVRVIIEIDQSVDRYWWNRLSVSEKEKFIEEVYLAIIEEYGSAKIKGYFKDISTSRKLLSFYYDWDNKLIKSNYKNYSTISTIEEKFNNDYDSYFNGIHFSFGLDGNDNRVGYTIYIQEYRFEERWNKLSDSSLRNFMKKLCVEINNEFKDCHVLGCVIDIVSGSELAYCEQVPRGEFTFIRDR